MEAQFLLYGAYGYTGRLIIEKALANGLRPLLAGRDDQKLAELAAHHQLDYLAFSLDERDRLEEALNRVPLVLHAAGPFIHTARPMLEACLATGTHYLDITGEIAVFELAHRHGSSAEQKNIMLMPGVGFDVVPTDCLARFLFEQLPSATHLQLAFAMAGGGMSRGTALTAVEQLGKPSAIREAGQIRQVPLAHRTMTVPLASDRQRLVMSIPWGDVSTAYYTTGIPNIETYTQVHPKSLPLIKLSRYLGWLLRQEWVRNLIRQRIKAGAAGPDTQARQRAASLVWGKVWDEQGRQCTARLRTLEGYELTATTSTAAVQRVLAGDWRAGFQTPAGQYGADFILEVAETERELL